MGRQVSWCCDRQNSSCNEDLTGRNNLEVCPDQAGSASGLAPPPQQNAPQAAFYDVDTEHKGPWVLAVDV